MTRTGPALAVIGIAALVLSVRARGAGHKQLAASLFSHPRNAHETPLSTNKQTGKPLPTRWQDSVSI